MLHCFEFAVFIFAFLAGAGRDTFDHAFTVTPMAHQLARHVITRHVITRHCGLWLDSYGWASWWWAATMPTLSSLHLCSNNLTWCIERCSRHLLPQETISIRRLSCPDWSSYMYCTARWDPSSTQQCTALCRQGSL